MSNISKKYNNKNLYLEMVKKNQIIFPIIILFFIILINLLWTFRNANPRDFGSFYSSGAAFLRHDNPYSYELDNIFVVEFDGQEVISPNLNPPSSLYLILLFTLFPLYLSVKIWRILSIIIYILCLFLLKINFQISKTKLLWGFCLAGFWHTVELGQIYVVLLLFITLAWIFIKNEKQILAGVFIGLLLVIKPNFAIWVLILVFSNNKKIFLSAVSTAILVSFLTLIISGPEIYFQWIHSTSQYSGYFIPGNSSIFGLTSRLGSYSAGYIPALILLASGVFVIYKYKPSNHLIHIIGLTLSILCSPIAWPGYTILLLPAMLTIEWSTIHKIVASYFVVPAVIIYSSSINNILLMVIMSWIYGFAIFQLFLKSIYASYRSYRNSTLSKNNPRING